MSAALLRDLRLKRMNSLAEMTGEPAVEVSRDKLYVTRGLEDGGGRKVFLPIDELIRLVETFLKS